MIDPLFFSQECSDARTCLRTGPVCMCGIEKMLERMRKLEAVAERARKLAEMANRDIPSIERSIGLGNALAHTHRALADLEE